MKVNYNKILTVLKNKYKEITTEGKNYFIDERNKIVASYDNDSISMYFMIPRNIIWNHDDFVIATFVRNFQVNNINADVMIVDGLCGACNDITKVNDFIVKDSTDKYINKLEYKKYLSIKQHFDTLSCKDDKIREYCRLTGHRAFLMDYFMEEYEDIELDLYPSLKNVLGPCGWLCVKNGFAEIYLDTDLVISGLKVNKKQDGMDLNILNVHKIRENCDYQQVYEYYRQWNDWHYRYNRGLSTIEWTERRKNSNVDDDAIHCRCILDAIYSDSRISLNARRLRMKAVLSLFYPNKNTEKIMNKYNFNGRNADIKSASKRDAIGFDSKHRDIIESIYHDPHKDLGTKRSDMYWTLWRFYVKKPVDKATKKDLEIIKKILSNYILEPRNDIRLEGKYKNRMYKI